MDYKDKYEQALERARTFNQRWQGIESTDSELALQELKEIFPELKESEDERNEQIRKALKSYFDSEISDYGNIEWMKGIRYGEVIAWLEKQGEQKHWKPSKKQMGTLEQWLKKNQYNGNVRYCYPIFESLYDDLKDIN